MTGIPLRPAPTDVRALLAAAMDSLEKQAITSEISLRLEVVDDLPSAFVDPEKIAWAVATLVGNALRFVRRGTRRLPGGSIVVRVKREGAGMAIIVEDDGPGIPPDKLPWLFERAPGKPHAAGLALMLVHDTIEAHGGTVEVDSATEGAQRGTRVTLRMPFRVDGHAGSST